ncbi:MAG: hypothetical protein PHI31_03420 [Desulfuromonadaceae bacterium]|nr:hypothetical protein [Desulfuromonadaceae bacterium]
MTRKTIIIFTVSVAFFTLAATYRFHDSAHSIGTIKKGGGVARHPAVLDKGRDSYVLVATAAVLSPYRGNARVALEGDPTLTATFYNSEVPINLGLFRHPKFQNNTYYDLRPKDKIALWVKIRRIRDGEQQLTPSSGTVQEKQGVELCAQCDQSEELAPSRSTQVNNYQRSMAETHVTRHVSALPLDLKTAGEGGRNENSADSSSKWRGKTAGKQMNGPAVAFYDAATNEPLLKIPIRFTGAGGGDDNAH